MSHKDYARLLCSLDVSVDSIPFGGGVTLCDAVGGGCSTRTESTMNTTEKIVVNRRQVVPFVTCGSLQSVHQIGEGIASRIDSDYFARATEGNSSERDFCGSLKCIAGDVHSSTKHCIDALKCLVGSIKESHVKTIAEYVSTAIHVAEVSSNRSCVVDCIPCGLNNLQHEATSHTQFDRVFKLIHKNTDAIREWESFLRRIVV